MEARQWRIITSMMKIVSETDAAIDLSRRTTATEVADMAARTNAIGDGKLAAKSRAGTVPAGLRITNVVIARVITRVMNRAEVSRADAISAARTRLHMIADSMAENRDRTSVIRRLTHAATHQPQSGTPSDITKELIDHRITEGIPNAHFAAKATPEIATGSIAPAMKLVRGLAMTMLNGAGAWTRCTRKISVATDRKATIAPTIAFVRT